MADSYMAEIRIFPFNFAPKGWALCNGQTLPVEQNTQLFSLLGTTYGGNGTVNFGLPNLQGRVPVHAPSAAEVGESGGVTEVTLQEIELPVHRHILIAAQDRGDTTVSSGNLPATGAAGPPNQPTVADFYSTNTTLAQPTSSKAIDPVGGHSPHNNMQPYLTLNFCISIAGQNPPRN